MKFNEVFEAFLAGKKIRQKGGWIGMNINSRCHFVYVRYAKNTVLQELHTMEIGECTSDITRVNVAEDFLSASSARFPKAGMLVNGKLYRLTTPERRTCGSASGSWPTLMAKEVTHYSRATQTKEQKTLSDAVMFPTPRANSASGAGKHGKGGMDLQTTAQLWGTLTANDAKNSLTESQRGRGTLTAHVVELCQPIRGSAAQLSADWCERLMGYPDGWTDIDKDDTDTANRYPAAWQDGSWDTIPRLAVKQKNRCKRIKGLGNSIVPQIAAYLWRLIDDY